MKQELRLKMYITHLQYESKTNESTSQKNNIERKKYIGQWESKGHKISIYTQDNEIWAAVKDVFGKVMLLPNEHIKGGINGIITQDNLLKMIECNRDRIEITLHQNRNNDFTLWIIPKLEAAGKIDGALVRTANQCAGEARDSAKLFISFHDTDNFDTACNKYQEAFSHYKKALNVRKKNREDTKGIETDIMALRKEFFLFKLKKIDSYLPNCKDREEVENNFKPFIDEEDVFEITLEISESTPEEKRSKAENFTCAYSAEFLRNYTLAIKSYLLLSKQHCVNRNQSSSSYCIKKAGDLIEEAKQVSDCFNMEDFLNELGIEWLSDITRDIHGNEYFKILLKENKFKSIADKLVKKVQDELNECNTCNQNQETFQKACKTYQDAIGNLEQICGLMKNHKIDTCEIETVMQEFKKKFFYFKLPRSMDFILTFT